MQRDHLIDSYEVCTLKRPRLEPVSQPYGGEAVPPPRQGHEPPDPLVAQRGLTMAEVIKEPNLFEPGDVGEYVLVQVGVQADNDEPIYGRRQVKPAIYADGYNADGTPTMTTYGRAWRANIPSGDARGEHASRHKAGRSSSMVSQAPSSFTSAYRSPSA